MMEWSDEQTISFIEMYRERSFLWDPIDSLYKNKNKRHYGLMEIAVSFGIEKCDVEKKIKNLQSQFSREKEGEEFHKNWEWCRRKVQLQMVCLQESAILGR